VKKRAKTKKNVKSAKGKKPKKTTGKKKISRKPKRTKKAVRKVVKKAGKKATTARRKVKKVTKKLARKVAKKGKKAVRKAVKKTARKTSKGGGKTKKTAKKTTKKPKKKIKIKSVSKPRERQPANPEPLTPVAPSVPEPETIPPDPVGRITHYYTDLGVAVILLDQGGLQVGDRIQIKGHTTYFEQTIGSMEIDHQSVQWAQPGQTFGLKVVDHAREHDTVYRLPSEA